MLFRSKEYIGRKYGSLYGVVIALDHLIQKKKRHKEMEQTYRYEMMVAGMDKMIENTAYASVPRTPESGGVVLPW